MSFLEAANGKVIGVAIGDLYAAGISRHPVLMGWLTAAGSKFWTHMEAAGIAKLDDEKKVVVL